MTDCRRRDALPLCGFSEASLFRNGDEYIAEDAVYGVKAPLIVDFVERPPGKAPTGEMMNVPFLEVKYDFVLERKAQALAAAE